MKSVYREINGRKVHSWRRQLPDHRDQPFRAGSFGAALPSSVAPLARGSRVHDQGSTNSCVGHAVTTALEIAMGFKGDTGQLSRLMAYYHAREYLGEQRVDEGCYIRDAFRGLLAKGVARESNWRFNATNMFKTPTATAMVHATTIKQMILAAGVIYEAPKSLDDIRAALAKGQCVVFGFTVYNNIFGLTEMDHILRMPGATDAPLGGHAVVADGYDDAKGMVSVQNSWGTSWGLNGTFLMPYEWFTSPNYLTGDFWTCRKTR